MGLSVQVEQEFERTIQSSDDVCQCLWNWNWVTHYLLFRSRANWMKTGNSVRTQNTQSVVVAITKAIIHSSLYSCVTYTIHLSIELVSCHWQTISVLKYLLFMRAVPVFNGRVWVCSAIYDRPLFVDTHTHAWRRIPIVFRIFIKNHLPTEEEKFY